MFDVVLSYDGKQINASWDFDSIMQALMKGKFREDFLKAVEQEIAMNYSACVTIKPYDLLPTQIVYTILKRQKMVLCNGLWWLCYY